MAKTLAKAAFLILGASLLAVQLSSDPAQARTRTFHASPGAVKQACGGGTYLGTNSDGHYGCLSKNGKTFTDCKKGKCTTIVVGMVGGEGKGETGGRPQGGTDGGPSGGSNPGANGNASMGNAGMSSGGGGGVIN